MDNQNPESTAITSRTEEIPPPENLQPEKDTGAQPPPSSENKSSLDDVIQFLAHHLHCSDHQLTLLAIWILHTHCFSAADVTPYLSIQSEHRFSGKTRCLQLLSFLCPNPALTATFTTANLSSRIHYSEQRPTFLLDDCQATIGSRRRSKNPILRAILSGGAHRGLGHTDRKRERIIFSPKAFAGIGPLPDGVGDYVIPIFLEPLKLPRPERIQRFRFEAVEAEATPLRQWLQVWAQENLPKLKALPAIPDEQFPPGLSIHRQDMIEPLLHIAGLLGGDWPQRTADAFVAISKAELQRERKAVYDLLSEIREAFSHHGRPRSLATATLLAWLHSQPERPWNQDGLITSTRLSNLLRPFGIRPRVQTKTGASSHRGYELQDFRHTFTVLLPPEPTLDSNPSRRQPLPDPSPDPPGDAAGPQATTSAIRTDGSQAEIPASRPDHRSEIANIDAGSDNLTTSREFSAGSPRGDGSIGGFTVPATAINSAPAPELTGAGPHPAAQAAAGLTRAELEAMGYRFGPFTQALDVEMIRHYRQRNYRPLAPHEAHFAEFRCNGVPFAPSSLPQTPPPPVPQPQKTAKEKDAEAIAAWIRREREAPPKCAQRENVRLAPRKPR